MVLINALYSSSNFKIGFWFYTIVLALQFIDCLNRLNKFDYVSNPYYTTSLPTMMKSEQLASKFYSQRNLYISGAVLYLELAIYTVSTIVRKLVAKQDRLQSLSVGEFADESEEIEKYKQLIKQKDQEIEKLKLN